MLRPTHKGAQASQKPGVRDGDPSRTPGAVGAEAQATIREIPYATAAAHAAKHA
ncbi:hypothetical protein GCM10010251_42300 [Streptomyces aurantiogriseus]|uniref:Uncharacterized protein n=1 Tax=Streptomyces aurantiogriseus TaxID=66870 RepID=A0A918CH94_9ACTN|nr:hypothetical protein GCM10010251_42300 [Streptomyces aurantiogriseus]